MLPRERMARCCFLLWLGDLSDCLESFGDVSSCSVGGPPGFSWCVLGALRAVLASVGSTRGQLKSITPVLSVSLRRVAKTYQRLILTIFLLAVSLRRGRKKLLLYKTTFNFTISVLAVSPRRG